MSHIQPHRRSIVILNKAGASGSPWMLADCFIGRGATLNGIPTLRNTVEGVL